MLLYRKFQSFEFNIKMSDQFGTSLHVCRVNEESDFILLPVDKQFPQHHLLKMLSFLECMFMASFVKNQAVTCVWTYI